jgi:hypothetical protein
MAVELTKVALWIETVEPGKPLGFLDANIRCGDSLLGVFDLNVLAQGIPNSTYSQLAGDDRETARHFAARNRSEREGQGSLDFAAGGGRLPAKLPMAGEARALRAMPEDSPQEIAAKRKRFEAASADPRRWNLRIAADLYMAAFLTPKPGGVPANRNTVTIPTTAHVWDALAGRTVYGPLVGRAQDLAAQARAFHWPLEFPDIMTAAGFDVVLGNPPWERIKLQEQEFFAAREPEISEAPNAAARGRLIAKLKEAAPGTRERLLYEEFEAAKRTAEASSVAARVAAEEGGRFPLTGRGDVNTYALFAELFVDLTNSRGRAGAILKAGILTDYTYRDFLGNLVTHNKIRKALGFNNQKKIFPAVHPDTPFVLLTIGTGPSVPTFAFELLDIAHIADPDRHFTLSPSEITRINPNTRTIAVFRSRADAELSTKIYCRIPVLINESEGSAGNQWGTHLRTMFHKSNASQAGHLRPEIELTSTTEQTAKWLAVHEGEYGYQYDHRYATFEGRKVRAVSISEHKDPNFEPNFEFVARRPEYLAILDRWNASPSHSSLMGFRRVSNAANERTVITAILPMMPLTYGWIVLLNLDASQQAILCANFNSLVFDYLLRNSLSQPSIPQSTFEQIPTLLPSSYSAVDRDFICRRVLELTYTSDSMAPYARALGYDGAPFAWDEDRRAQLRGELDAWYVRAYGLTRDELRYVLDPADVKGPDYPSETFRVLKKNEIARFGEYRTARLVLAAYDQLMSQPLAAE